MTDADGTVADVVNGTNATFVLNTANVTIGATTYEPGELLTVSLTAAPTTVTVGTAGLQYPATVTNTSGLEDTAGNRVDLGVGRTDKVVD